MSDASSNSSSSIRRDSSDDEEETDNHVVTGNHNIISFNINIKSCFRCNARTIMNKHPNGIY